MTIPSTARKAGPLLGTGVQTAWPFTFKVFAESDILVTSADSDGVETVLVLDADYSVVLNANQDTSPGGTVTYPLSGSPLAVGSTLTVVGDLDYDQPLDIPSGGNFSPAAIENELDRLVMQIQQLREITTRAFLSPVSSSVSSQLPAPAGNALIGWDATGTALQNVPLSSISTVATYGAFTNDPFTGDGVTTTFPLTYDPLTLGNLTAVVDGLTFTAGTDFTLSAGSIVFAVAPVLGAGIVVRYGQALDAGTVTSTGIVDATATGRSLLTAATAASARATLGAAGIDSPPAGNCQLSKSGANLILLPKNGNTLRVGGVICTLPDAGITLSAPATTNTTYFIYALATAGVVTSMEASATAHATSATAGNQGIEIKSGDDTRTLVGIARTVSSAWVDTITQRFVRSYFNRTAQNALNAFTATRSTSSAAFAEVNTEIRNEFVCWADDSVTSSIQGSANNISASVFTLTAIGWDGVADTNTSSSTASATGLYQNCSTTGFKTLSEGYHYTTLMGVVGGSTGNWASGIIGVYTSLSTKIG